MQKLILAAILWSPLLAGQPQEDYVKVYELAMKKMDEYKVHAQKWATKKKEESRKHARCLASESDWKRCLYLEDIGSFMRSDK